MLHEFLIIPLFALAFRQVLRWMKVRHVRNSHLRFFGGSRAHGIVVVECAGLGDARVVVQMLVLVRRIEWTMVVEELQHHEEGLLELLHPLHRKIRHVIGDVSGIAFFMNNVAA